MAVANVRDAFRRTVWEDGGRLIGAHRTVWDHAALETQTLGTT